MKITFDAKEFVDKYYDDDQRSWVEDSYEHLEHLIEVFLDKHGFEEYKINVSNVDIIIYVTKPSWNDPGDFNLTVEGKVEVEVK